MKEASHFLRNIGQGEELCILDRHILRELDEYGIVPYPKRFDASTYLQIESEMKKYAKEIRIPVFALDFVFWAETHNDVVFK
jgi:N-glycosylase/DNA lyase